MIKIAMLAALAITQAAFEAIASTLPLGSVAYDNEVTAKGERYVWLDPHAVNRLKAMRGAGESYSDVILRLTADGGSTEVARFNAERRRARK